MEIARSSSSSPYYGNSNTNTNNNGIDSSDDGDEPYGTTPLPTSFPPDSNVDVGTGSGGYTDGSSSPSSPVPVSVTLDLDPLFDDTEDRVNVQQPQTQQIAVYDATPNEDCINGSLLDVNQHFVVYTVKNGLIRVLHRHSAMRALLRAHAGQTITDIRFFLDGDVLGTIGTGRSTVGTNKDNNNNNTPITTTLIIWRVFEQSPEIMSEKLLEISTDHHVSPDLKMSRLIWHPFNPNQFWMVHTTTSKKKTSSSSSSPSVLTVATLVETTRIQTRAHPSPGETHALCQWHSPYCVMDGAVQLIEKGGGGGGGGGPNSKGGDLTDLSWSGRDTRHVLTVHDNGSIILWDLKQKGGVAGPPPGGSASVDSDDWMDNDDDDDEDDDDGNVTVPRKLFVLHEKGVPHSRCCFLPHDHSIRQGEELRLGGTANTTLTTCFATASYQNTVITLWSAFIVGSTGGVRPPTKLQEVNLVPHPTSGTVRSSFVIDVCFGPAPPNAAPPSCFLLVGSRQAGRLLALHVKSVWSEDQQQPPTPPPTNTRALCVGVDYFVPFVLKHPIYSWSVVCSPTQDIAEEEIHERAGLIFDIKAFAYQSKFVQCLTMTSYMCLPPEHGYKKGEVSSRIVQIAPLTGRYVDSSTAGSATAMLGESQLPTSQTSTAVEVADFEEDYDIDGDDDNDDDDDDNEEEEGEPEPLAQPRSVLPLASLGGNPFANWLGAIAAGSSSSVGPFTNGAGDGGMPPPPPQPSSTQSAEVPTLPMPVGSIPPVVPSSGTSNDIPSFLKPMDLFQTAAAVEGTGGRSTTTNQGTGKDKKKKGSSISPKRSVSPKGGKQKSNKKNNETKAQQVPDGKIAILKRDRITVAPPPPPLPNDPSVLSDPAILAAAGIPVPIPPPPMPSVSMAATIDPLVLREQVTLAVEEAVTSAVVPAVNKAVQESFSNLARPLRSSMDKLSKQGVTVDPNDLQKALNVETPLKAALAETMRTLMVPVLESISGQLLQQVQASMPPPPPDQSKTMEALVQQLANMNSRMDSLMTEVQGLRTAVADQAAAAASSSSRGPSQQNQPPPPQAPSSSVPPAMVQLELIRNEIIHLLSKEQYEAAFTRAVSASTAEMAVFACTRADLSKVLGGPAPTLSQPIILCLMQQLGAALPATKSPDSLSTVLSWLQEIALTLNPTEPSIARHVPGVLQQLVAGINTRMASEGNGQIRRRLQMLLQVLRGMTLG